MVCPTCLYLPLVLTSAIGTVSTKNLIIFQVSLLITFIFLFLYIKNKYYTTCQSCEEKTDIPTYFKGVIEKYFNYF